MLALPDLDLCRRDFDCDRTQADSAPRDFAPWPIVIRRSPFANTIIGKLPPLRAPGNRSKAPEVPRAFVRFSDAIEEWEMKPGFWRT
jgi:hypothetical protein